MKIRRFFCRNIVLLLRDQRGSAIAEYAMIAAFFGMLTIGSLQLLGTTAIGVLTTTQVAFDNRNGVVP
jgi:Flp pilus assembly pilin Flp